MSYSFLNWQAVFRYPPSESQLPSNVLVSAIVAAKEVGLNVCLQDASALLLLNLFQFQCHLSSGQMQLYHPPQFFFFLPDQLHISERVLCFSESVLENRLQCN